MPDLVGNPEGRFCRDATQNEPKQSNKIFAHFSVYESPTIIWSLPGVSPFFFEVGHANDNVLPFVFDVYFLEQS